MMALQDHYRPPLSLRRHWNAFHHAWATYIAADLNRLLPEGYFAERNVQFGIEIDVATFEEVGDGSRRDKGDGGQPVVAGPWTTPAPTLTIPISIVTDTVEVLIYNREAGPTLAGAIELVSPANKDRPAHREAFVSKCETYLQQGLGLLVVDVVTDFRANLHDQLLTRLGSGAGAPWGADLYAAAYRPVLRGGKRTWTSGRGNWWWGVCCPHCRSGCRAAYRFRLTWLRHMSAHARSSGSLRVPREW